MKTLMTKMFMKKELKVGDEIKPWLFGILCPFGVVSLAVWGLWCVVLAAPITGLINKPELVKQQLSETDLSTYLYVIGGLLLVLGTQILFRFWIKKRHICLREYSIMIKGVVQEKEVSILDVKTVTVKYDKAAIKADLQLVYGYNNALVKISGWLMSSSDMESLAEYILQRNRHAQRDISVSI